jgi:SRSO17 transposase
MSNCIFVEETSSEGKVATRVKVSVVDIAEQFVIFIDRYSNKFVTRTSSVAAQAKQYLCGLMQANNKNMERMAEVVPDSDEQVLQHFLTNSPWDTRAVLSQVAHDVDTLFGNSPDTCLIIDESGNPKKGEQSVGVARQWCGNLGKIENCQVGVYAALACGHETTLIDTQLYLPKSWTDDPDRCRQAGVPEEYIVQESKAQIALETVRRQKSEGIRFNWVGMDAGYGKEPWLLRELDKDVIFVADVHKDQHIYLEDPKPIVPEPSSNKGAKPTRLVAQSEDIRVDQWVGEQPRDDWHRVIVREGTKGMLEVEILQRLVWVWDGEEKDAHCWHLIVRREIDSPDEIKYSLSNAPAETSLHRLAFMQAQRFWVERALQDGKSESGLDHYQVRLWQGWYHHMALVMMAMLFMLEMRRYHKEDYPLLSCSDIEVLLAHFLPRRDTTVEEVLRQMKIRHKKRQSSIDSAMRRQAKERENIFAKT